MITTLQARDISVSLRRVFGCTIGSNATLISSGPQFLLSNLPPPHKQDTLPFTEVEIFQAKRGFSNVELRTLRVPLILSATRIRRLALSTTSPPVATTLTPLRNEVPWLGWLRLCWSCGRCRSATSDRVVAWQLRERFKTGISIGVMDLSGGYGTLTAVDVICAPSR